VKNSIRSSPEIPSEFSIRHFFHFPELPAHFHTLFALVSECPDLRAPVLETVVEPQTRLGVHGIQHEVDVLVGFVVVG
jgi:hypothetical protein